MREYLSATPNGLDEDEIRDLREPRDVLSSYEDTSSENRDLCPLLRHGSCPQALLLYKTAELSEHLLDRDPCAPEKCVGVGEKNVAPCDSNP